MDKMEYDAFSAGVEPGGLRNKNEIKVLIAFLIENLERPLSKRQLFTVIQQEGLANYFEASQALSELMSGGIVDFDLDDEEELLRLTANGRTAMHIETDVPKAVREKALNATVHLQTLERRMRENKIEITELENGCDVTFSLMDGDDVLMKLTLYVADMEQAKAVRDKILEDPVKIYSQIIASLAV